LFKTIFYLILFFFILFFGLTFSAQNPQVISIRYYFGFQIDIPLVVLLLGSLALGILIGWLSSILGKLFKHRKTSNQAMNMSKRGNQTLTQLDNERKTIS